MVQVPIDWRLYPSHTGWTAIPWLVVVAGIISLHRFPLLLGPTEPTPRIPAAAVVLLMFILASHAAAGVEMGIGGVEGGKLISGLHLLRVISFTSTAMVVCQVQLAAAM